MLSPAELAALRVIHKTGKRDYEVITELLYGKDTAENRREAYKVFARWKDDEVVWKEGGRWVVEEDVFEDDDGDDLLDDDEEEEDEE